MRQGYRQSYILTIAIMHSQHPEWEVQKILQRGSINNMTHYLVKWVGYPLDEATWEPLTNLDNCQHAILQFENSIKSVQAPTLRKNRKRKEVTAPKKDITYLQGQNQATIKDHVSGLKDKKVDMETPDPSQMIELIPKGRPRMTLDDERQLYAATRQVAATEHQEVSDCPSRNDDHAQTSLKIQFCQRSKEQAEKAQYLQLFQIKQNRILDGANKTKSEIAQPTANGQHQNSPKTLTQHEHGQFEVHQPSASKKRKKGARNKVNNKSHRNDKRKNCETKIPINSFATDEKFIKEENYIAPEPRLLQQQQPHPEKSLQQEQCPQAANEIEIKDPHQFMALLLEDRQIKCQQALKAFQRNTILSITQHGLDRAMPINCPILDLYHRPEALSSLGSVSISRNPNTKMLVRLLVRLRSGWFGIGKVDGTLSIGAVRVLDDESWNSIFSRGQMDT